MLMKKDTAETQVVTFRTGMETYGMEINRIREIIMPHDITSIPGMTDTVKGIINLRGEIIPVVELAAILNAKNTNPDNVATKPRVIILDQSQGGYGILVDEVMQVIKVQPEDVKTRLGCEHVVSSDRMVKGIIHAAGEMIIYLDPTEISKGTLFFEESNNETDHVTVPI
jgi:chemotaxis signal transduction protein